MCSIIFLCKKYETDGDAYQTKETERRSNAPFSGGGGGGRGDATDPSTGALLSGWCILNHDVVFSFGR